MDTKGWKQELVRMLRGESEVIVVDRFIPDELGLNVIRDLHALTKHLPIRIEKDGLRYSMEINPEGVVTNRLFRSWNFVDIDTIEIRSCREVFSLMRAFQSEFIVRYRETLTKFSLQPQIIHYPSGGGFFDWHRHPRYPMNYGLIVSLSKQGREFETGNTEIRCNDGSLIKIEDYERYGGGLVLFKYDLEHRVAPCDPKWKLIFDTNGKWSAICRFIES